MYLSKNSRYVLLKSPWFSRYLVERSFRISFRKSGVKWPEEDPTKPPLRLNIPRDTPLPNSYNLHYAQCSSEHVEMAESWQESADCSRLGNKNSETCNDSGEQNFVNEFERTFEHNQESSEKSHEQNFEVNPKLAEFQDSKNKENELRVSERNLKLSQKRSNEDAKLKYGNENDANNKNGVLTIQIEFDDLAPGDTQIAKDLSQGRATKSAMSDDKIAAIAEAVIKELEQRDKDVGNQISKDAESQKEEAFLVIVDVKDKDTENNPADDIDYSVHINNTKSDIQYRNNDHSINCVEKDKLHSSHDGHFEDSQVRDLKFFNDMGEYLFKRETRGKKCTRKMVGHTKRKNSNVYRLSSGAVSLLKNVGSANIINGENYKTNGVESYQQMKQLENLIRFRQKKIAQTIGRENRKPFAQFLDIAKEKERRRKLFEKSIRRGLTSKAYYSAGKTPGRQSLSLSNNKFEKGIETGGDLQEFSDTNECLSRQLFKQIACESRMDMSLRNEVDPGKDVEEKMKDLEDEAKVEPTSLGVYLLKTLCAQIKQADELPVRLKYPEHKYSFFSQSRIKSKNSGDAYPQLKTKTIRNYHSSYNSNRKSFIISKPSLTFMAKLDDSAGSSSNKVINKDIAVSKGDADRPLNIILKSDRTLVCTDYYKNKIDEINISKMSENLNESDIYLQEGEKIDKRDESVEAKKVETDNSANENTQTFEQKEPLPEPEIPKSNIALTCTEEKCELDITDICSLSNQSKAVADDEALYLAPYLENGLADIEEKLSQKKMDEFIDASIDTFVMNEKCLDKQNVGSSDSGIQTEQSIGETLLNSKKDNIMNVVKNTTETNTPKLSDNIVNLANESLAESKGSSSVDSLSMMKRVKEIVDLDLKNAEKIFVPGEPENISQEYCESHNFEASECMALEDYSQLVELPIQIQDDVPPPNNLNPSSLVSVIIYDDTNNKFYIQVDELEHAMNDRRKEMAVLTACETAGSNLSIIDSIRDDFSILIDIPQTSEKRNYEYNEQQGDSMITYDEKTKTWTLDPTLVKGTGSKKEQIERASKLGCDEDETRQNDKYSKYSDSARITQPAEFSMLEKSDTELKAKKDSSEKDNVSGKKNREGFGKAEKKMKVEVDAEEIRRKNSDLYDDVFEAKKNSPKTQEEPVKKNKKIEGTEKIPSEHYVSDNIVEMSKNNGGDKSKKVKPNKVETVKLNIATQSSRPPSKVTEINLNKKNDEGKVSTQKEKEDNSKTKENNQSSNRGFYNKFEKYKTPFSDPEYEEKPMKINTDLESNPNLKKLDSWNKTLVLPEVNKSSEKVESWLKDETDQMATLLLRVLQEAAEGNSRRRIASKTAKGNPYEAIRKKQENNSYLLRAKKKDFGKKRGTVTQLKVQRKVLEEGIIFKDKNEVEGKSKNAVTGDEPRMEFIISDSLAQREFLKDRLATLTKLNENSTDDIPGPDFLKKLSAVWNFFPSIGCQAAIFILMRLFQMAKSSLSVFSADTDNFRKRPFGKLFMNYGPLVKLEGPMMGNVVLVCKPEDVMSTFVQAQVSPGQSIFDSLEKCRCRDRYRNFPSGITDFCNGIEWDIVRKSTIDVMNKGCLQYFNLLKNANSMLVNKIDEIRNRQNQVPDNFMSEIQRWSLEGLCSILFDKSLGFLEKKNSQVEWVTESERLMRNITEATGCLCQCESNFQVWRFINTPAMSSLNQAYQSLDVITSKYVYQAEISLRKKKKALTSNKQNANSLNFIESALLSDRMMPEEITANLIDILLFGANTTTIALSFLLYNLAQNRRVQRQLFREIKDLLPQKDSQLGYHQLHSLKYLQACLKESMRLHIPTPLILRVLPNDITLANYRVPQGTHIVMDLGMACMKEQNFDEPERFKPERWLEQDIIHPFSSIPFCSGPRSSFVKQLTEVQLWTCIAKIVRNFEIDYEFGDIRGTGKVLSYPNKPLKLTFINRNE